MTAGLVRCVTSRTSIAGVAPAAGVRPGTGVGLGVDGGGVGDRSTTALLAGGAVDAGSSSLDMQAMATENANRAARTRRSFCMGELSPVCELRGSLTVSPVELLEFLA